MTGSRVTTTENIQKNMKLVCISKCLSNWRSSHYAVTHVRNTNTCSNIQGRLPDVVKVIYHTIRNCS